MPKIAFRLPQSPTPSRPHRAPSKIFRQMPPLPFCPVIRHWHGIFFWDRTHVFADQPSHALDLSACPLEPTAPGATSSLQTSPQVRRVFTGKSCLALPCLGGVTGPCGSKAQRLIRPEGCALPSSAALFHDLMSTWRDVMDDAQR